MWENLQNHKKNYYCMLVIIFCFENFNKFTEVFLTKRIKVLQDHLIEFIVKNQTYSENFLK